MKRAAKRRRTAVPSPEMLAGNFNFGGLNPIYDPATTAFGQNSLCQPAGSDCWYRLPFPNNQVPQSRFDPAVKNFLSHNPYMPENNTQRAFNAALGPTNNLITPTNYRSYRTRFDAKIDQQFSPNHKMFGRYSHVRHRSWRDRVVARDCLARIRLARGADSDRSAQRGDFRHVYDQSDDDQ